jgi:hypothetical protein
MPIALLTLAGPSVTVVDSSSSDAEVIRDWPGYCPVQIPSSRRVRGRFAQVY